MHQNSNFMKKVLSLAILATTMLFTSCEKDSRQVEQHQPSSNRIVVIPSDNKTASTTILVSQIGHDGKNCPGCILSGGQLIHVDCMGDGRYCRLISEVQLQQTGSSITATTTDTFGLTTEDFFAMPDRSLYFYTDENNNRVFLNIPSQLVFRDTVTKQFTFTRLFLTNAPEYSNN